MYFKYDIDTAVYEVNTTNITGNERNFKSDKIQVLKLRIYKITALVSKRMCGWETLTFKFVPTKMQCYEKQFWKC